MKNIHLLPTDKPSRLYFYKGDDKYPTQYGLRSLKSLPFKDSFTNQNIYITSDEEIKEGDWVYSEARNTLFKVKSICNTSAGYLLIEDDVIMPLEINEVDCKKIILTTDQDLNGVQAIDDEFLEWFVGKAKDSGKPIDIVEVGKTNKLIDNYAEKDEDKWEVKYHIYIPKEEPKQKPLEEARANSYIDFAKSNQEVEMYSFVVGFNRGAKWQEQQTIEQEFGKKITDVNYEKSFDEIIEQAKEIEEKQQENIYERERFKAIDFAKWFSDFNGLTWEEKRVTKECLDTLYEKYLGTLGGGI